MKIENLHQPFIYKNNQNEINLIVSEFPKETVQYKYGGTDIYQEVWKLHHLDSSYNKTIISTPSSIVVGDVYYDVVAECNGFLYNNKISYVIGGLHLDNNFSAKFRFFLVKGDFNDQNKSVTNLEIIDNARTGFIKEEKYTISDSHIIKNDSEQIFNYQNQLDGIARIIPIYNSNKIIYTGNKDNNNRSFLYDMDLNILKQIKNTKMENIYKSSIYDDGNSKLFAYTEKIVINQIENEYILNIEDDYFLENL